MAEDDLLVQIETDKVTIDVRYQQQTPGVVKEILVKMDDTVQACSTALWLFAPTQLPAYLPFLLAAAPSTCFRGSLQCIPVRFSPLRFSVMHALFW